MACDSLHQGHGCRGLSHDRTRPQSSSRRGGERATDGLPAHILAALANAVTLILIVIAYEAVGRLQHPQPVTPWILFLAAAVGIAVNLYIGLALRSHATTDLNVRAAVLHVFGDIGASMVVM
jgi:cobalt-zinc-cadmium efflux system protein